MSDYTIDTTEYGEGIVGRFEIDPEPMSPDDWDNLGTLALTDTGMGEYAPTDPTIDCPRCEGYGVLDGPTGDRDCPRCEGTGEIETDLATWAKASQDAIAAVPIRFSDYGSSGATIYATDDPEDANGVIYTTPARAKDLGVTTAEDAERILRGEVETWDDYYRGNVYAWMIEDEDGEMLDAVGGYYGEDYARQEMKENAEHHVARRREIRERNELALAGWRY